MDTQDTRLADRRVAFGEELRAAREAKGLSVAALAQATRISVAFIEALEAGALDKLPGEVFGRGFVRSLARTMQRDPGEWLQAYDGLWEAPAPKSVLKVEIKNKPNVNRGEHLKEAVADALSLMRRGLAVRIGVPLVLVALAGYGLVKSPLWPKIAAGGWMRGSAASVAPAPKVLDVSGKDEAAIQPTAQPGATAAVEPVAAQPEEGKELAVVTTEATPAGDAVEVLSRSGDEAVDENSQQKQSNTNPAVAAATSPPVAAAAQPAAAAPAEGSQVLELTVTEPVRVKIDVDAGKTVTKELTPDVYKFTFSKNANLLVYDAAALKISFNGKALGTLGTKGRVRRLSFAAGAPEPK